MEMVELFWPRLVEPGQLSLSSVELTGWSSTSTQIMQLLGKASPRPGHRLGLLRPTQVNTEVNRQIQFLSIPSHQKYTYVGVQSKISISFYHVSELVVGLLSGGRTRSSSGWSPLSSVEIFGGECAVADLPQPRSYHVSFVTPDDRVMVCGGLQGWGWSQSNSASCLEYNLDSNAWRPHSYLRAKRERAVSVSFPSGVLVLGGQNVWENYYTVPAYSTSDYLARGSSTWQAGPDLPIVGGYAYDDAMCAVAISDTSMLVIGLRSQYQYIWEYSMQTFRWSRWSATFRVERHASACHKVGDTVVVAGGYPGYKSTEVIDLNTKRIRQAGDTASPRFFFGFLEMGLPNRTLILTFGGVGDTWAVGVDDSTVLKSGTRIQKPGPGVRPFLPPETASPLYL